MVKPPFLEDHVAVVEPVLPGPIDLQDLLSRTGLVQPEIGPVEACNEKAVHEELPSRPDLPHGVGLGTCGQDSWEQED